MKRVAVCLHGVNRSLSVTHRSIIDQVVAPWSEFGEVRLYGAFLQPRSGLNNPRSSEVGVATESESLRLLPFEQITLIDQDAFDVAADLDRTLAIIPDYYKDGHSSTKNIFRSLHALNKVHELATLDADHDYVLFVRPDLFYIDRFDAFRMVRDLGDPRGCRALTPLWQQWGGLNDRLAICTPSAAAAFAKRFEQILDFCAHTDEAIQAERLLLWACMRNGVAFDRFMTERGIRVRATGMFREEQFQERGISSLSLEKYKRLATQLGVNQA